MGSSQSTLTTPEIKELREAPPGSVSGRKQSTEDVDLVEPNVISINEEDALSCASSDDSSLEESDTESDSDDDDEEWNERLQILEDNRKLRQFADFFMHPEKPVAVDGNACGRCFFSRPEAPAQTTPMEETEAAQVLADVQKLQIHALYYLCPDRPIETDPTVFGRNYFSRSSSYSPEEVDTKEWTQVLDEAHGLKKLAVDFMQPEKPVMTSDPSATGRNFFSRPSAPTFEDEDERAQILADAQALKKLAVDYLHPERPVVVTDPCACARNYFTRPSADEYDEEDDIDDKEDIMEDMKQLKKLAQDYLEPDRPVQVDPLVSCRNYFARPSARDQEEASMSDERAQVLADALSLKKIATDYMHPEKPVTSDGFSSGRNYFSRPSAPEYDEEEDDVERDQILVDACSLKQLAVDYMYPEKPVVTSDPFAVGRNYYSRPSAEEYDDEREERELCLSDAQGLKKLAVDYMCPEKPVAADAFVMGRNYFSRPSADEYEEKESERLDVFSDVNVLKKLAIDYLHPEKPVEVDGFVMGRNFFSRPSAEEYEDADQMNEHEAILEDAKNLKKLAIDYHHPEMPVNTLDTFSTGRNYFNRGTAPGHSELIHTEGQAIFDDQHDHHEAIHYTHHDYYHHYHIDDHHHADHHSQSDHFEMDEDVAHVFGKFRESLSAVVPFGGAAVPREVDEEGDKEGNLSRSPSSVMLFDEAM